MACSPAGGNLRQRRKKYLGILLDRGGQSCTVLSLKYGHSLFHICHQLSLWQTRFSRKLSKKIINFIHNHLVLRQLSLTFCMEYVSQSLIFCTPETKKRAQGPLVNYIQPRSAIEQHSSPTIMWSSMRTSMKSRASSRRFVISSSAGLGSAMPEGWLCAIMQAAALWAKADFTTSRGYTAAALKVPLNISSHEMTLWRWSSHRIPNTSCSRCLTCNFRYSVA